MTKTHLLELTTSNQPWNLVLFWGIPFAFAVLVSITELYVLYRKETHGVVKSINIFSGWILAAYFSWVVTTILISNWIPMMFSSPAGWRGIIDFFSMTSYLLCYVPLLGMAFSDLPWASVRKRPERRLLIHAVFVALFLVLGHLALFLSLFDPTVFGLWKV